MYNVKIPHSLPPQEFAETAKTKNKQKQNTLKSVDLKHANQMRIPREDWGTLGNIRED